MHFIPPSATVGIRVICELCCLVDLLRFSTPTTAIECYECSWLDITRCLRSKNGSPLVMTNHPSPAPAVRSLAHHMDDYHFCVDSDLYTVGIGFWWITKPYSEKKKSTYVHRF